VADEKAGLSRIEEPAMDLSHYRSKECEKQRSSDLMGLVPDDCGGAALDVGARDGWFSALLAERFDRVTALDLEKPDIDHPKIDCVKGDVRDCHLPSGAYDLVFCAEVLEHIPTRELAQTCRELERLAGKYLIIGVPYKQDIRVGRTRCATCGRRNPPWGHVNVFDEKRLRDLFGGCDMLKTSFVGWNHEFTNALSSFLMDLAGNPYGTYRQEEPCIHCGAKLREPPARNFLQKVSSRLSFYARNAQGVFHRPHQNWIHALFAKREARAMGSKLGATGRVSIGGAS
jgi:SAM-dependent methyltransferase